MQRLVPSWKERYKKVFGTLKIKTYLRLRSTLFLSSEHVGTEDVLVIRYEGPKGSPGMPEVGRMLGNPAGPIIFIQYLRSFWLLLIHIVLTENTNV